MTDKEQMTHAAKDQLRMLAGLFMFQNRDEIANGYDFENATVSAGTVQEWLASFALEQAAIAVAEERKRILAELEKREHGVERYRASLQGLEVDLVKEWQFAIHAAMRIVEGESLK